MDWDTNRPRNVAPRYYNDNSAVANAVSITETQSFHSFSSGGVTLENPADLLAANLRIKPVGFTTIYVNIITTTANGVTKRDIFANYNIELEPIAAAPTTATTVTLKTVVGTGIPDALPNDGLFSNGNFGTVQWSTSAKLMPSIFNLNGDGTASLTVYNMDAGENQRGQIYRGAVVV